MRLRIVRAARSMSVVLLVSTIAACGSSGSEDDSSPVGTERPDSTVSSDVEPTLDPSADSSAGTSVAVGPFVPASGEVPVTAEALTSVADVSAALSELGFPGGWLVPDGLGMSDVAGIAVRQSAGDDSTTYAYRFAFYQPAGVLDDLASTWYDQYASSFGIGPAVGIGTKTGNDITGRLYSGGLADEPAGRLTVTAVGEDGGPDPVVIEVEFEIESAGPNITLSLSSAMLDELPDITGCQPFLVQAGLARYVSPNSIGEPPGFRTIFDGNCPTRATFDAAVAWAIGRDGRIIQDDERIEVTDTTGPDGTLIHVGASLNSSIRIDTDQLITSQGFTSQG